METTEQNKFVEEYLPMMLSMLLGTPLSYWEKSYGDQFQDFQFLNEENNFDEALSQLKIWYGKDCLITSIFVLINHLKISKEQAILEIGCGNGHFCEMLAGLEFQKVIGLDYSDNAIALAKLVQRLNSKKNNRSNQIGYVCQDILENTFSDHQFDFIYDKGTLDSIAMVNHHILTEDSNMPHPHSKSNNDDRVTFANQIARILKPGKFFTIISSNQTKEELTDLFEMSNILKLYRDDSNSLEQDMSNYFIGVDCGTSSIRAAVVQQEGKIVGVSSQPISIYNPLPNHYQQSSSQIWNAGKTAIREALSQAASTLGHDISSHVRGIGFDATCSLVVLDANGEGIDISMKPGPSENVNDIILWMDHRATKEAEQINSHQHNVLKYVGGKVSPEMECPKILWLKRNKPQVFASAGYFFDLVDFLTFRATGKDFRSCCTVTCKWNYMGKDRCWSDSFFQQIGLEEFPQESYKRIGKPTSILPMGTSIEGGLTTTVAEELGLPAGTAVGIGLIDAHAGGLGVLGSNVDSIPVSLETLHTRVALVCGTSTCHMAVSKEPYFIEGIWGPYWSSMVDNVWLTEGGQSATGKLIDYIIETHPFYGELKQMADSTTSVYDLLLNRLKEMAETNDLGKKLFCLTADLHVYPDFHGNRSPLANPELKGMICGLDLNQNYDHLALLYLATCQAIAFGTRHIIENMNEKGYAIDTIFITGGLSKNPLYVQLQSDISNCKVVCSGESDAVLLGSSILGAVASGYYKSLLSAMDHMNKVGLVVSPSQDPDLSSFFAKKYRIFKKMCEDQLSYQKIMQN